MLCGQNVEVLIVKNLLVGYKEVTCGLFKVHEEQGNKLRNRALIENVMIPYTVIPRLTKMIRSGITFVSRNVISRRFL